MEILTYPPITFVISLIVVLGVGSILKVFELKTSPNPQKSKTYACGEDFPAEKIMPSYEEFYPYAIFFTILHVVALMLMTLSFSDSITFIVPAIYSIIIAVILAIIFIIR
ncbi:MAG: NADH-quinone oxidoreductase subunit A [Elusimicrobiales bacterium]